MKIIVTLIPALSYQSKNKNHFLGSCWSGKENIASASKACQIQ